MTVRTIERKPWGESVRSIPLLGLAAMLTFTLTGCSGGDEDKALELARQVCGDLTPSDDAAPTVPSSDPLLDATAMQSLKDFLPTIEKDADQAAQAARLDSTWNALAKAVDQSAALASTAVELGAFYRDQRAGINEDGVSTKVALLEQQRAQQLQSDPLSALRAECRKTTGV
ncbi:hypothetical protein [Streptomyces atratus]|uniref:hypothetical protein n=1 Tax=Streptomyces atratus TaxID=1893 RepID=UPI0036588567